MIIIFFILQPSLQNSVTYVYDGKKLTGIVNNVVQQTVLTGNAYVVRGLPLHNQCGWNE